MSRYLPSERTEQIQRLFDAVVDLDPDERSAYVERACAGDHELRREVGALLDDFEHPVSDIRNALNQVQKASPALPRKQDALIGQTPSRYQIQQKLGSGGMGVVYKAHDTKLDRSVALKFLPPHLSLDDEAKIRLIHEAKAASALDHLNICTVYDIDETDQGRLFISMAYYQGETLKQKIERGPLPLDEAIDYVLQMADGLKTAHAAGIVHRDVKPANVIITETGRVKLVDFGLAKIKGTDLTKTGLTLGTVAYMSPEQARGEAVDHRTDIWSLGVVLYEIITGEQPFSAEYEQAVIYAILNVDPEPLHSLRADLPHQLQHVVRKALQKKSADRYQDVQKLSDALESFAVSSEVPPEMSIVVLPFEDISPADDNAYFSDGLTEELISDLSQVHALRVISRNSSMMLKGTHKDTRTIGRELEVQYVLEGSVRKAGNDLRITAQLIDANDDRHIWADKYRGTLDDVFTMQENVSRSIVDALKVKLSPQENERIVHRPIDDVRAYECYLKARHEILQFSEDALNRGLNYLDTGLKIVGENALLLAGMGYVHWQYVNAGIKPRDHLVEAEGYVDRIFKLEPDSSHGHRIRGLILFLRGDVQRAVRHLKQSLATDPNNPDALLWLSILYGCLGETPAARPLAEKLLTIDPLTPINHGLPGWLHFVEGQFDLALASYRTMYEMERENPVHRFFYVHGLAYTQHITEAFAVIDQLVEDTPEHPFAWMCSFFKHALQQDKSGALEVVTPELRMVAIEDLQYSWFTAVCYALIDMKEEALDWLENAISRGFTNHAFFSEADPLLANIRGEERFRKLMDKARRTVTRIDV